MTLYEINKITQSMLDCKCNGNGIIFLNGKEVIKCPIHFSCATNEEYRLEMLRLEYQNLRRFVLEMVNMTSSVIDLNAPTTSRGVDEFIEANYAVGSAESWVRAIQQYVREYLLTCD